jgi:hypothetical protein
MSANRLLTLIADQGAKPRRAAVARWTETPEAGNWEPEPEYGAFVDEDGRVVPGTAPARAFLGKDDPARLELASTVAAEGTLVFVDWGRQSLPWNEVFSLWDKWERQGLIRDCGAVSTAWPLERRWVSPGWILFQGDFDGSPLTTTVVTGTSTSPEAGAALESAELSAPKEQSFLAIAKALRGEKPGYLGVPAGNFPMLPFTLEALRNPGHAWPQGL